MASLQELSELLITRYVPRFDETEELETIEEHRAGGDLDIIDGRHDDEDDVCLIEDRPLHGMVDTPKLVAKPREMKVRDEAKNVLRKLKTEPAEKLRGEKYDYYKSRWFNTTRESELELIEHVFLNPNARPHFFAIQSRLLHMADVQQLILTSLLAPPQCQGQSLARIAIKTTEELGFKDLWKMLNELKEQNDGFEINDGNVVATYLDEGIGAQPPTTIRLSTKKLEEYGEVEDRLDAEGELMSSRVVLTCSIRGKRHVQTQVTYFNNGYKRSTGNVRTKYVEVDQTVKCMNRRVLIAEDRNEFVEFEVDDEMLPLREAAPRVEDLIDFLRADEYEESIEEF